MSRGGRKDREKADRFLPNTEIGCQPGNLKKEGAAISVPKTRREGIVGKKVQNKEEIKSGEERK